MKMFSRSNGLEPPASGAPSGPKHRSILTTVKTIRTPRLRSKKSFGSVSPGLTSLEFSEADVATTRYNGNASGDTATLATGSTSLSKTKLLVDTSLKGEVERNLVLEQQLQQLGEVTSRLYDEIYFLQQKLLELELQMLQKDVLIGELQRESSPEKHRVDSVVSASSANTNDRNSMHTERVKSVSTLNTSIHYDPRPEPSDKAANEELVRLQLLILNLQTLIKNEKEQNTNLAKQNQEQDVEIARLHDATKSLVEDHNGQLQNLRNIFLQLSRNYSYLYAANSEGNRDEYRSTAFI